MTPRQEARGRRQEFLRKEIRAFNARGRGVVVQCEGRRALGVVEVEVLHGTWVLGIGTLAEGQPGRLGEGELL